MQTSISDNTSYPEACRRAATDDTAFSTFKRETAYTDILEHVTYEEGKIYSDYALLNKDIAANIDKFKINDKYGNPRVYEYPIGTFSPTTLRYMKILSELSQLNLNDTTIVEIGAGYGGQYTILRQLFKPKKYIFVDMPEALLLIEKYVNTLGLNDIDIEYYTGDNLPVIISDLVISNYAFSECNKSIQDNYVAKAIKTAAHGFMLYNNMLGYTHEEFIGICSDKKIRTFPEMPQTHPKNVLLVW